MGLSILFTYLCTLMMQLSILIPVYNSDCTTLVATLCQQARSLNLCFEVIVADDGSKLQDIKAANRAITQWEEVDYIELPHNIGRAAIRNLLAERSHAPQLLFLDCDVVAGHELLSNYLRYLDSDVVCGGIAIGGDPELWQHNLRYRYEKHCEPQHTSEQRQLRPYQSFRTTNFMVRREVMQRHPFDERITNYGYEDVLFGKALKASKILITHIENPVGIDDYEDNATFLLKTEEALRTLCIFSNELRGYNRLLTTVDILRHKCPLRLLALVHRLLRWPMRRCLLRYRCPLTVYQFYRLTYFTWLLQKQQ